jgi:AcrR family transcriptional regulator
MGRRPHPERRAEICRTAAQIIRERGFEATSLSEIAAALGISKSGLYYYTTSKHSLLYEIMMFGLDQIEAEVVAPVRGIADPEQRLSEVVNRHVRIATRMRSGRCPRSIAAKCVCVFASTSPSSMRSSRSSRRPGGCARSIRPWRPTW